MNILETVKQGSDDWRAARAKHFCASDAGAMMGDSKYKTRNELLREKASGITEDISPQKQRLFDAGHDAEASARGLAEEIIGESLFPVTAVAEIEGLSLLASLDGATADDSTLWEHKLYGKELASSVERGDLDLHYIWQMEHQLLVTSAERVLFMVSDGTAENLLHCWYYSDPERREALIAGWRQFAADMAEYVPPEVIPATVAAPQMALPAVTVQVQGSIAVRDNLAVFGDALMAYVERINKQPETDQDFADLEATVKSLKTAEEALDAAESGALAQTDSIDAMRRTVAQYRDIARTNRLMIEKLVKAEKENRRATLLREAQDKLADHIKTLNARLGKPYMPVIQPEFQSVIKGLKSLDSMRDKLDTELVRCKIGANAVADRIEINLNTLRELAKDHTHLFPDTAQIVGKGNDDLVSLIKARIADENTRLEAVRVDAERQAQEKAEREAAAPPAPSPTAGNPPAPYPAATTAATSEPAMVRKGSPAPWNNARNRVVALLDRMTMHQLAEVEKHILATFPHLQEEAA